MTFARSLEIQKKIHAVIPGGSHTYAKGDDQYPEFMPPYLTHGHGCHVWDADGNEFIEYGMGLRAVTLGHGFEPVVEAAYAQMRKGSNYTRPAVIELEAAEELLSIVKSAEMVKFAKNGSDANNGAVKLARAYTGRDLVAICGTQPFFSVDDWFIGATAMDAGIPQAIKDLTLKFRYNDIESVRQLFAEHPKRIACIILEAEKEQPPQNDFLLKLQTLCRSEGAVFILDEMITGFRWHLSGAQAVYGLDPDLSTFGKAMSNGFSLSALTGKRKIMRLGGLDHDKPRVFLGSTTHGAENHALAAGIAVMRYYQSHPVVETLCRQGTRLAQGFSQAITHHRMEHYVLALGRPECLVFGTRDIEGKPSQPMRTLFMQELLKRGVLASSLVVSYAHTDEDIDRTIQALDESLGVYRKGLENGVERYLVGRPVSPVFRKFN
ncbi:MAG TPA: glutamate-1-semialdehyde 2,1-aminomutase [Bacteroidota bacterium]|nr:glutamate-1-semialdehyde 2,1-aminomutase [Bacteroidota bacterium]